MTKLNYYLTALAKDQSEWKSFREFLGSPYFSNSEIQQRCLDGFSEVIQGNLAEADLVKFVYPEEDPRKKRGYFGKVRSQFQGSFDGFLAVQAYQNDPFAAKYYLLKALDARRLDRFFEKIFQDVTEVLEEQECQLGEKFRFQMELADLYDRYLHRKEKQVSGARYQAEIRYGDQFFEYRQLKMACDTLNLELIREVIHNQPYLDRVLEVVEAGWDEKPILIQYYFLAYKMLLQLKDSGFSPAGENQYFLRLKAALLDTQAPIAKPEWKDLMEILVNFCTLSQNFFQSNAETNYSDQFVEELAEIYGFQLEHKIIFQEAGGSEYLDHGDFINIVTIFSGHGKWNWVADFIDRYAENLDKDLRGEARSLARGILLYKKGKVSEAGEILSGTIRKLKEPYDQFCALKSRVYNIRCLFESGEYEDCRRALSAFDRSMKNKVKKGKKGPKKYRQFVRYTSKLCLIVSGNPDRKKADLIELESLLKNEEECISLKWLLERVQMHRKNGV